MQLVIKNKLSKACTVGDFTHIKREMMRALADYLITNGLVKITLEKGNLIVEIDVKKYENNDKR